MHRRTHCVLGGAACEGQGFLSLKKDDVIFDPKQEQR
jgi:hypothetical protein